jgi:dihydroorotase
MKETSACAAGVYTGPYVLQYLADALDSFGALDRLHDFACVLGRKFYGLPPVDASAASTVLVKKDFTVENEIRYVDDEGIERTIVPYKAGKTLKYSLNA